MIREMVHKFVSMCLSNAAVDILTCKSPYDSAVK